MIYTHACKYTPHCLLQRLIIKKLPNYQSVPTGNKTYSRKIKKHNNLINVIFLSFFLLACSVYVDSAVWGVWLHLIT